MSTHFIDKIILKKILDRFKIIKFYKYSFDRWHNAYFIYLLPNLLGFQKINKYPSKKKNK